MQENQVASLYLQPFTLKVVVRPIHGHIWHSPWMLNQSQHGYLVVIFLDVTSILQWLDYWEAISLFYITTDNNCLFAVEIAYISKCVCKITNPVSPKLVIILLSSAISAYDMCTISNTLFFSAMNKPKV